MQYNAECARLGCELHAAEDCAIKMAKRRDASENRARYPCGNGGRRAGAALEGLVAPEELDDFYVKFISDDIR